MTKKNETEWRLIEANALKEKFSQDRCGDHFLPKHFVISTIDNAPTVDIENQLLGAELHGIKIGYEEAQKKLIRPQGEWKEHKLRNDIVVEYAFKCSNCKKDSGLVYRTDFCPNCGADMRDKKNESENEL